MSSTHCKDQMLNTFYTPYENCNIYIMSSNLKFCSILWAVAG